MGILTDGYSTTITFLDSSFSGVTLYEKTVTPPGVDGGGPVDITTMRNLVWRTQNPKQLKTLTDMTFTAAYQVSDYSTLVAAINVNQQIRVTFPDASTVTFWGWLNTFQPGEHVEGEQPVTTFTIHSSNQNDSGVETAPVVT